MCKFLKNAILFFLIFSIIFPNYAEASVDSDAFITKQEFDSVLQDFNKKLEIFEAGVNSKIDQQVTTYLDRNGIWSANAQVLKKNHLVWTYGINVGTELTYTDGLKLKVDEKCYSTLPVLEGGGFYKLRDIPYVLIEKVNKTGLCCLMYSCFSNGAYLNASYFANASARRGWFYPANTTTAYRNNACKWDNSIYIYQPVNYDINSRNIADSLARFTFLDVVWGYHSATPGFYFMPLTSTGILYFFVTKDYPLYFVEYQSAQFNTNYAASCLSEKALNFVGGNYSGFRIDFNSVDVY